MAIPVGSCEVWMRWDVSGDSEPMFTHLAYDLIDVPDQASVDAGFAAIAQAYKALTSNIVFLGGGHILVGNDGGSIRWDSATTLVQGTGSGENMAPNVAVLVKKVSALGGRRNRGRMYVPVPLEGDVNGLGNLSTLARTAHQTAADKFKIGGLIHTAFGFVGQMQILHETGSQTPTECTDLIVDTKVATQRRRLRR